MYDLSLYNEFEWLYINEDKKDRKYFIYGLLTLVYLLQEKNSRNSIANSGQSIWTDWRGAWKSVVATNRPPVLYNFRRTEKKGISLSAYRSIRTREFC